MPIPTYFGAGAISASATAITPAFPASTLADDIALLVLETENQAISLATANGFAELGVQANKAAGTAATDPANLIAVYWKRLVGGDASPITTDAGNHQTGVIHVFRGVRTSGNPWEVFAEDNDGAANDTTGAIPGAVTTLADCLIVLICGTSYNVVGGSTTEFSGWTNANLVNLTERIDFSNTVNLGGGHGLATGELATPGNYGNTTVDLAHTSYKGQMSIALVGAAAAAAVMPTLVGRRFSLAGPRGLAG
jgi:hypothetical protein